MTGVASQCDKRRPVSVVQPEFPHVDFKHVTTDEDSLWRPDVRETMDDLAARCAAFLALLKERPEKHIAVVSHGVFLEVLWERINGPGAARYMNCELRVAYV